MRPVMAALICCLAACGSGNGNGHYGHEVDIQRSVWHCVSITKPGEPDFFTCYEAAEQCEKARARAMAHDSNVRKCEQNSFAYCFRTISGKVYEDLCSRTEAFCKAEQKLEQSDGHEVTDCKRVPTESSHRLQRLRNWRTARRR